MRFHDGLRVYILLFQEVGQAIKDFIIFFVVILLMLTLSISTFFTSTGGSMDFARSVGDALQALSRLTFGFYE